MLACWSGNQWTKQMAGTSCPNLLSISLLFRTNLPSLITTSHASCQEQQKHFNCVCDISLPSLQRLDAYSRRLAISRFACYGSKSIWSSLQKWQCLMAWHGTCSLAQAVQLEGLGKAKNWPRLNTKLRQDKALNSLQNTKSPQKLSHFDCPKDNYDLTHKTAKTTARVRIKPLLTPKSAQNNQINYYGKNRA